jgi:hypothetical protein
MTSGAVPDAALAERRLHNTGLTAARFEAPEQVVRWFGAVQSQDYGPAKWSLGQRVPGTTDAAVDAAFDRGTIVRTHALRPTWHFVDPADLRWIQRLTGPRVHALNAYYYRQLDLDESTLTTTARLLVDALRGGPLTRSELRARFELAGVGTGGFRLAYILMHAELNALICSGPLHGKQHTYALVDERVPPAPARGRDEALAELTLRYFTSHGPATTKDFAWWSSQTMADVRAGLDLVGAALAHETVGGLTYWFADQPERAMPPSPAAVAASPTAHLLQAYDEYVVAFNDSKYLLDASGAARAYTGGDRRVFNGLVILDGQLAGHWRRRVTATEVLIETQLYRPLDAAGRRALRLAADRHGAFLGLPAAFAMRLP